METKTFKYHTQSDHFKIFSIQTNPVFGKFFHSLPHKNDKNSVEIAIEWRDLIGLPMLCLVFE